MSCGRCDSRSRDSMMGANSDRIAARLKLVDEHVRHENAHDLDAIMGAFGATAHSDDEPWGAHYVGRDQVRTFYQELLHAVPGLRIDIERTHASATAVVLEVIIRGQHLGTWRGLPGTGAQIELPLCGIFTFDDADRLAVNRSSPAAPRLLPPLA